MSAPIASLTVALDHSSQTPLYKQLYQALRDSVLQGRLTPGARLPATRTLATDLQVSRNTVMIAFEQLLAEGYLEGKVGAGTYVAGRLPEEMLHAGGAAGSAPKARGAAKLSRRGTAILSAQAAAWLRPGAYAPGCRPPDRETPAPAAFRAHLPSVEDFPFKIWARLSSRRWRRPAAELLGYGDPAGYRPLREQIAAYVGAARAVRCDPAQVIVVGGSQQGLDLVAGLLLNPGDRAWVEEPGYPGARAALLAAGARIIPVRVDAEGLDVAGALAQHAPARVVYVTPSHQFPLGVTMTLSRRLALLEWARHSRAWIIEDDYDSQYRYAGRPIASLQGIDDHERVIYLGTFSKVMFPGLRLGYLVAPPDLVDAFTAARRIADWHSPMMDQALLADFIAEGHFARHIRRMRTLYEERQAILVKTAGRALAGRLDIRAVDTGMNVIGWLADGADEKAIAEKARRHGVEVTPLSVYRMQPSKRRGLLLGYASLKPAAIRAGVERLAAALK